MNVELLRKVQAHILEEPKRLIMDEWIERDLTPGIEVYDGYVNGDDGNRYGQAPQCGTVGCIGGWARQLSEAQDDEYRTFTSLLDLPNGKLFYVDHWPLDFCTRYENSKSQQERAQIVSDIIDYTIDHPGWMVSEKDEDED